MTGSGRGGSCKDPFCPQSWGWRGGGAHTRAKTPLPYSPHFCSVSSPRQSAARGRSRSRSSPPSKRDQLGVGGGVQPQLPPPQTQSSCPTHTACRAPPPHPPLPQLGTAVSGVGGPIENIPPPPPSNTPTVVPILSLTPQQQKEFCAPPHGPIGPHPTDTGCSGGGNAGGTVAGLGGAGGGGRDMTPRGPPPPSTKTKSQNK